MSDVAIETRGIVVVRGRARLLDGLDLTVRRGELTAVVGRNGSGKTTLLRVLAGIVRPNAGRVSVAGRDLADFSRRTLARELSYLPQDLSTEFDVSVADAVSLGRYAHRRFYQPLAANDRTAVATAIERLDLSSLRERDLATLSGGERQRVFLARALAQESRLMLLDEPTTALDIGHQLELMDVLASLHDEGRTLVVAMHDLHLVWSRFERAVLLDRGRVAADGSPRDVLAGAAAERAFGVRIEDRAGLPMFHRAGGRA